MKRREFVRVSTAIEADVVLLSKDGRRPHGGSLTSRMVEIGGGGARLQIPSQAEVGNIVTVHFRIPDTDEKMELSGRVVEVVEEDGVPTICVKFVGMKHEERATLLRYVFREQIRQARMFSGKASEEHSQQ